MEPTQNLNEKFQFEDEIKILNSIYSDMLEAIQHKPNDNDLESLRLYADNVYVLLNRTVLSVQEIKNSLLSDKKIFLETYNPPA
jgi:hypothetical protein